MRKMHYTIILFLCICFCSCSNLVDTDTPKSTELSEKYEFYEKSVANIRNGCQVTPEEADEIFLVLVNDCGVSALINYGSENNDGSFTMWSSGQKYTITLEDNIVSTVSTMDFLTEVQLYPKEELLGENNTEESTVTNQLETTALSNIEKKSGENISYDSLTQINLDALQQLYLNFDSTLSYSDALEYIQNTGLPYSEEKYNGSRQFQIALSEGCTAQKYMKESCPYIKVIYEYVESENSANDDFSKYTFGTCIYNSGTSFSLIVHNTGHYFDISSSGTYIKKDGNTLNELTDLSKEEQLLYYFNNQ